MTAASLEQRGLKVPTVGLFTVAIFTSAALVFTVQPLIARMLLPQLGGSPAVWNASMVFFQAALLVGYVYAHLLQRISSLRAQFLIHLGLLAVAALTLPLGVDSVFGAPSTNHPTAWLLGTLAVSVGPPFAILSATAPLLQAWYARTTGQAEGATSPYAFYAASNLGSMLALLSYPVLIEPLMRLDSQAMSWAAGYGVFGLLALALAATHWNQRAAAQENRPRPAAKAITWRDRLSWIVLAAVPSGLMLGATSHLSADVASAPFLWVVPLALYLLTFVLTFQTRPPISKPVMLACQAVSVTMALALLGLNLQNLPANLIAHLSAFFFSTLVCHTALAERRPDPRQLTEFYMLMSLGGVIGGAVTALAAPAVFDTVLEYPILIVLALAARPWARGPLKPIEAVTLLPALIFTGAFVTPFLAGADALLAVLAFVAAGGFILLSRRGWLAALVMAALVAACLYKQSTTRDVLHIDRSFFGVHRVVQVDDPVLGGPVHLIMHGTTLHGAQPQSPTFKCRPSNYFAPEGAIGQTYRSVLAARGPSRLAVVGLGAGSVATYGRAGDQMKFFEIDPLVEGIARDPAYFTYLSECTNAAVDVTIGDARLTLQDQPAGAFDLVHLDAFTSDAIPTHLLTAEAMRMYLKLLKPDGILLVHISNRNMDLEAAVAATAASVGGVSVIQRYVAPKGGSVIAVSGHEVVLVAKSPAALARFARDRRWRPTDADGVRPWTDDYTNIIDPILRRSF